VGAASRRAIRHAFENMDTICGGAAQFPFAGFDDDVVHGFLSQLFIEMLPSQRARDGNWQTCSDVSTTVLFSAYSTDDDAHRRQIWNAAMSGVDVAMPMRGYTCGREISSR